MSNSRRTLVVGLLRETGLALLAWIGVLTASFITLHLAIGQFQTRYVRMGADPSRIYDLLPVSEGFVLGQWLELVVGYSTLNFGTSGQAGDQARELILSGLGGSLYLFGATILVGLVLALPLLVVAGRVGDGVLGGIFDAFTYLFLTLWPLATGMFVLVIAYATDVSPTMSDPFAEQPVTNFALLTMAAIALAVPLVADVLRRARRIRRASDGPVGLGTLLRPDRPGPAGTALWFYLPLLAGGLVVLEQLTHLEGAGYVWWRAITELDLAVMLGAPAALAGLLIFAGWWRGVATVVARSVGDPGLSGVDPGPHDPGALREALVGNRRIQLGGALLALSAVLGLGGSLVLPAIPDQSVPGAPVVSAGTTLNTIGSVTTVALVTLLVATVLGVPGGLIAAVCRRSETSAVQTLGTVFRLPAVVAMVAPFAVVVGTLLFAFGAADSRFMLELQLGSLTGVLAAGFVFRGTYRAGLARLPTGSPDLPALLASGLDGLTRVDLVVIAAALVGGELAYLGVLPASGSYEAFGQLVFAFEQGLLIGQSGTMIPFIHQVSAGLTLPVVGFALVADGVGTVLPTVPAGASVSSPADASSAAVDVTSGPDETVDAGQATAE